MNQNEVCASAPKHPWLAAVALVASACSAAPDAGWQDAEPDAFDGAPEAPAELAFEADDLLEKSTRSGCSAFQIVTFNRAEPVALRRVDSAIRYLSSRIDATNFGGFELDAPPAPTQGSSFGFPARAATIQRQRVPRIEEAWFGPGSLRELRDNFIEIRNEMRDVQYVCAANGTEAGQSGRGCGPTFPNGGEIAFTSTFRGQPVFICQRYFQNIDNETQVQVLIHENVHHIGFEDRTGRDEAAALELAARSPAGARSNPQNYTLFASKLDP